MLQERWLLRLIRSTLTSIIAPISSRLVLAAITRLSLMRLADFSCAAEESKDSLVWDQLAMNWLHSMLNACPIRSQRPPVEKSTPLYLHKRVKCMPLVPIEGDSWVRANHLRAALCQLSWKNSPLAGWSRSELDLFQHLFHQMGNSTFGEKALLVNFIPHTESRVLKFSISMIFQSHGPVWHVWLVALELAIRGDRTMWASLAMEISYQDRPHSESSSLKVKKSPKWALVRTLW